MNRINVNPFWKRPLVSEILLNLNLFFFLSIIKMPWICSDQTLQKSPLDHQIGQSSFFQMCELFYIKDLAGRKME